MRLNCCLSVEITEQAVPQEPDVLARQARSRWPRRIQRFRDVGVEHLGLQFLVGRYPERLEQMERFSQDVLRAGAIV